ncbi:cytochrome P450 [Nannocystis bainbridge]|uniref:Cytochrome P450 n=1 Tax=Nannocystis bainbridge TaxID=2995303 RepID=A0ABT5DU64_9BACT|nr:cytochrome P450 [Nannocystis bainbridge]MDC0717187.1 cytochrome P450 [Nannocystis bainbridge]
MHDPLGLYAPESRDDPYPVLARLRREAPLYFAGNEGAGSYIVTRYADVASGFRDPRLSASRAEAMAKRLPPEARQWVAPVIDNLAHWILLRDPPDHTRLRGLLNQAFTPRLIETWRPRIQQILGELMAAIEPGEVDLVHALAAPLPVLVIGDMLGLPPEDRHRLKACSDAIAGFFGASAMSQQLLAGARAAILELEDYFRKAIAERREAPRQDLLSALVVAEEQGSVLSEQELLSTCTAILFGGHETTTNLIANTVYSLLRFPDQLQRLRDEPGLLASAIEEVLRFECPVSRMGRVARVEFEWHGQQLNAGDRLFLSFAAANRDEAQFPEPDRFDIARADNRHLGFSVGPHYCIGAALGRMEARLALEALLKFPRWELREKPTWLDNLTVRGPNFLRVALT